MRRAEPPNDSTSDEEIALVVAQIKRLARSAGLEFALRVGAVIIHHFYDGDTEAWRARGRKASSFRRLAAHPELPLSSGSLYRCVALYELCDRLNAASRWEHLGASHLRVVLGLPTAVQEKLLALANSRRWTVKELQAQASSQTSVRLSRGGRRARSLVVKGLLAARKCLDEYDNVLRDVEHLEDEDLELSLRLVQETQQRLDALSRSLHSRGKLG